MKRTHIVTIIFSIILVACSAHESNTKIRVGSLEPIWIINPLDISAEPWFGGKLRVDFYQDYIFVADNIRGQVLVLNHKGDFVRYIGAKGSGPGEYRSVWEVQVSPEGSVYVNPGLYQYSLTGEHVTHHRHIYILSPYNLSASTFFEVLSDSLFVYSTSRRGGSSDLALAKTTPLVAFVMGDSIVTAGQCILTESEERALVRLPSLGNFNYFRTFSNGSICKGIHPRECIYVRKSNPYYIFILSPDSPMNTIHYYSSDDPECVIVHKDIPADNYDTYLSSKRPDAFMDISPQTNTQNFMTFKHSQRGIGIFDTDLYIYVEILNGDNTLKYLYKIDLLKGVLTHRIPVELDGFPQFVGISPNGLFIFEVTDPNPGLAAYNIKLN